MPIPAGRGFDAGRDQDAPRVVSGDRPHSAVKRSRSTSSAICSSDTYSKVRTSWMSVGMNDRASIITPSVNVSPRTLANLAFSAAASTFHSGPSYRLSLAAF